jgi:hypothetical protein
MRLASSTIHKWACAAWSVLCTPAPVTRIQALFNAVGAGAPDAVLWLLASGLIKDVNAQAETIEASAEFLGVAQWPRRINTHAHFAGHFLWLGAAFWRSR